MFLPSLCRRLIDTERSLDRVGCTITTFPAPGSAAIADPFAIAQRVVLVLEETQSVLQLFNVSGNSLDVIFSLNSCLVCGMCV